MTPGDSRTGRTGTGPWPHALLAAGVGAVAAHFTHASVVAVLLTGLPGLVVLVVVTVVTGGALAVCAALGTGRRRSAWLGTTALLVVPAVLVVDVLLLVQRAPVGSPDGGLSASPLLWLTGAVVAVVPALLVHVGGARRPTGPTQ